jgi:hypothetical protein
MLAIAPFAKGRLGIAGLAFFLFHNLFTNIFSQQTRKSKYL